MRPMMTQYKSPFGSLTLVKSDAALEGLHLPTLPCDTRGMTEERSAFREEIDWLDGYFAGQPPARDLRLAPRGTPFQLRVWKALEQIPYGETSTYGAIAKRIGRPSAVRAVGASNARNPISIIVPCHRVIGADGQLVGYAGGLPMKRWLLAHEARHQKPASPA